MNTFTRLDTPVGTVSALFEDNRLCAIHIGDDVWRNRQVQSSGLSQQLHAELQAYFTDRRFQFSLPLELHGTDFQQRIWRALSRIPAGSTTTYGQLARQLHSSPRAVGNACRANPVPIIIPCHRVVAKQGLGGYDGQTEGGRLAIKRWLLQHEGVSLA